MDGSKPLKIGRRQIISNILTAVIIFLLITSLYSVIIENRKPSQELPLSELAQKIIEENSKNNLGAIGLAKAGFILGFDRVGGSGTFVLMKTIAEIKK